jgi:hypothetical protein
VSVSKSSVRLYIARQDEEEGVAGIVGMERKHRLFSLILRSSGP